MKMILRLSGMYILAFLTLQNCQGLSRMDQQTRYRSDRSGLRLHSELRSMSLTDSEMDNINSKEDDHRAMLRLTLGVAVSRALSTFVDLGIPDILGEDTFSVDEIARQVQPTPCHSDHLLRILRLLSAEGIVKEASEQSFQLTRLGKGLLQKNGAYHSMVHYCLDDFLWRAWNEIPTYVSGATTTATTTTTTEKSPFESANGLATSTYYSQNPKALTHANEFVRLVAQWELDVCVHAIDWSTVKTVVDLGGYQGGTLEAVKAQHPHLECYCLDLPHVVAQATSEPGIHFVGGDMFDPSTIPTSDAILLKHILLCEFDEPKSLEILQSCYSALPKHGKIFIAEAVIDPDSTDPLPATVDVFMMLDGRTRSRSVHEWENLAGKVGFRLDSVTSTACPTCSILSFKK